MIFSHFARKNPSINHYRMFVCISFSLNNAVLCFDSQYGLACWLKKSLIFFAFALTGKNSAWHRKTGTFAIWCPVWLGQQCPGGLLLSTGLPRRHQNTIGSFSLACAWVKKHCKQTVFYFLWTAMLVSKNHQNKFSNLSCALATQFSFSKSYDNQTSTLYLLSHDKKNRLLWLFFSKQGDERVDVIFTILTFQDGRRRQKACFQPAFLFFSVHVFAELKLSNRQFKDET